MSFSNYLRSHKIRFIWSVLHTSYFTSSRGRKLHFVCPPISRGVVPEKCISSVLRTSNRERKLHWVCPLCVSFRVVQENSFWSVLRTISRARKLHFFCPSHVIDRVVHENFISSVLRTLSRGRKLHLVCPLSVKCRIVHENSIWSVLRTSSPYIPVFRVALSLSRATLDFDVTPTPTHPSIRSVVATKPPKKRDGEYLPILESSP